MTRRPARAAEDESASTTAASVFSSDARRPGPTSPEASGPDSGSTTRTPRALSRAIFSCVAGFCHMCVSIAGAMTTGALVASTVVAMRSSAMPFARREMTCAVAGATTMTSASRPIATCPTARSSCIWNISTSTGRYVSAWNVIGRTNSVAERLMTTCTVAPACVSRRASSIDLYAAIEPVTPRTMKRPRSASLTFTSGVHLIQEAQPLERQILVHRLDTLCERGDRRPTGAAMRGEGVRDAIRADLGRVVDAQSHAGLDPRPDDESGPLEVSLSEARERLRERRYDAADDEGVEIGEREVVLSEESVDRDRELILGAVVHRREAPGAKQRRVLVDAEDHICVADVCREDRGHCLSRSTPSRRYGSRPCPCAISAPSRRSAGRGNGWGP